MFLWKILLNVTNGFIYGTIETRIFYTTKVGVNNMHRLNANKSTVNGTSHLGDSSIRRIEEGLKASKTRRANKQTTSNTIQKTAKKISDQSVDEARIVVASLNEIPSNFERIGTGFYREGHHLWEMTPGKGGFVLTRKHGEDHVLGYDPEPFMKKESAILVTDRNGIELKRGHKVKFPYHGKIATGTILVLSPSSLDLGMDDESMMSYPPGMVEFLEEETEEGEHSKEELKALEEFLEEEAEEHEEHEEHEESSDKEGSGDLEEFVEEEAEEGEHSDEAIDALEDFIEEEMEEPVHGGKEAGDEFEPEIEKKTKSDYTGPESSQVGGIGGMASKKAQVEPTTTTDQPKTDTPISFPDYPGASGHSAIATKLDQMGDGASVLILSEDQNAQYFATKNGSKYDLYMVENKLTKFPSVSTPEDLMEFEGNIGRFSIMANPRVASILKAAINTVEGNGNMQTWKEYWYTLGKRVAEGSIPKPKLTEEEKKQRRKERRKQRQLERSGLPKSTALPPKHSAMDTDDIARYKEIIKIYETNFDELEYAINSISPDDPASDALAADAVIETLDRIKQERHELEEEDEEEMEDDLSLDEPSDFEIEMEKNSSKITVSMTEL